MDVHLGSMGFLGDFYMPRSSGGGGAGEGNPKQKHTPGNEQLRHPNYGAPRVVETDKYDYPRLQKFYEWEQFLDWVDWRGCESERLSHNTGWHEVDENYRVDWVEHSMTPDFQTAMNLAYFGWHDALCHIQELDKLDLPINPTLLQSYDIHTEYNVAGGAVNIGRFLAGIPDCMRAMKIASAHTLPARIQKILIVSQICAGMAVSEILQNGYALYQIVEAMERANIRTDITMVEPCNKYHMLDMRDYDFYECYIKIKRAGDPFYPEKMLFQLAHPAMKWRLIISERERNSLRILSRYFNSYGFGAYIPEWRPTSEMSRDALVIYSDHVQKAIPAVKDIIKSQYDKIR